MTSLPEAKTLHDLEKFLFSEIEAQFVVDPHAAADLVWAIREAVRRAAGIGYERALKDSAKICRDDAVSFAKIGARGNGERSEEKRQRAYQMCSHTGDALIDASNDISALPTPEMGE